MSVLVNKQNQLVFVNGHLLLKVRNRRFKFRVQETSGAIKE
jgi:hypothetical protein